MPTIGSEMIQGMKEALAFAKGEADAQDYVVHIPGEIDVKAIRAMYNMTQEDFAKRFGFALSTLQQWEQGRRKPGGSARAYLTVIERKPEAVFEALYGRSAPIRQP